MDTEASSVWTLSRSSGVGSTGFASAVGTMVLVVVRGDRIGVVGAVNNGVARTAGLLAVAAIPVPAVEQGTHGCADAGGSQREVRFDGSVRQRRRGQRLGGVEHECLSRRRQLIDRQLAVLKRAAVKVLGVLSRPKAPMPAAWPC